ncbi:hypothetical protein DL93DRAFT_2085715 [Clavulina sp. PMI_390]|nr:hypothetical protein DL93DRAFT_2085715 [Clavulina sp. PMI_390]
MCIDYLFAGPCPFLPMPPFECDVVPATPNAFHQPPYNPGEGDYRGIASRISCLLALSLPKLRIGNSPWYKAVQYSVSPRPTWQ